MIDIRYKNKRFKVNGERPLICECCGNKPSFSTQCHHEKYAYTIQEVKNNPQLALENTIFLCYHCHRCADHLRNICENLEKCKKLGLKKFEYNDVTIK